jgi:hypothetical protein
MYTNMITSVMLARQAILPDPPNKANSFAPTLLRALCRSEKSQVLCNQANPDSFCKTAGVGYPECFYGAPRVGVPAQLTVGFCGIDLQAFSFQNFTNPSFRNSFACTSIQNPGGVA